MKGGSLVLLDRRRSVLVFASVALSVWNRKDRTSRDSLFGEDDFPPANGVLDLRREASLSVSDAAGTFRVPSCVLFVFSWNLAFFLGFGVVLWLFFVVLSLSLCWASLR